MNVFVESNFILELAFSQTERVACEKLLLAAEAKKIILYVPIYCLTEVFQTLGSRRIEREVNHQYIQEQIKQHLREASAVPADIEVLGRSLQNLLRVRTQTQTSSLFAVTQRIAQVATIIPLTATVLAEAQIAQLRHALTPQDALVFASVCFELDNRAAVIEQQQDSLFVSRNESDFKKPDLLAELRQYNCNYLSSFQAAVGRLRL